MIKGIIPMTYCFFNKNNTIDLNVMHEQISLIKKSFDQNNIMNPGKIFD